MPTLELRDAISVVTGIITLTGVFWALRASVAKLEVGQTEVLRQLGALHKRMDKYAERLTQTEQNHAVLAERVRGLKESQRFKLQPVGEVPMFTDEGE